jgi:hypothetical protein
MKTMKRRISITLLSLTLLASLALWRQPAFVAAKATNKASARIVPLAVPAGGGVIGWGSDGNGQVSIPVAAQSGVTAIAAGGFHSLALKDTGEVIGWGWNRFSQVNIPAAAQSSVAAIAAGYGHSLALKATGEVIGWGLNDDSQVSIPVAAQSGVTAIAAGGFHSLALKATGEVIGWGLTDNGAVSIPVAAQNGVTAIAAGRHHSLALKATGEVIGWGYNFYGQVSIPVAAQSGVTAIAAGDNHSLALKDTGEVIGWGYNFYGQVSIPVAAQSGVTAIAAGQFHSLALKATGEVIGWGLTDNGAVSIPVAAQSGVTAIAAGGHHSLALKPLPPPNTAPMAMCQNVTVPAVAACSADASINNGSFDPDGDAITLSQSPAGPYPLGTTTVELTVTDSQGAASSCLATVTVVDQTAPTISCPAKVVVYLPPNTMDTGMVVNYPAPTASDNCSASPTITTSQASGSIFPVGTTTVNVTATDATGNQTSCSFTVTVRYNFSGFFQPVDNLPTINSVNAGQSIPVKFSLSGNKGLNIFAAGYPQSAQVACGGGGADDIEETVTAGGSSLSYDATTDQYKYVWKTEKAWKGTCRKLVLKFNDGTTREALFQFK